MSIFFCTLNFGKTLIAMLKISSGFASITVDGFSSTAGLIILISLLVSIKEAVSTEELLIYNYFLVELNQVRHQQPVPLD